MSYSTRNYMAHGGEELVIGGKLTFLPGATVEGAEGLFDIPSAGSVQLPPIADSTATSATALRADFNALLSALRSAGIIAAAPAEPTADTSAE